MNSTDYQKGLRDGFKNYGYLPSKNPLQYNKGYTQGVQKRNKTIAKNDLAFTKN